MPLKRQLQYQYNNFAHALSSLSLPSWVNSKIVRVTLVVMIICFGSAYVIKTASGASSGYEINKLENTVQTLEEEIDKLEVDIAEYGSLVKINQRLAQTNMVALDSLTFYDVDGQKVAKR